MRTVTTSLLLLIGFKLLAQTPLSGTLSTNTTLDVLNSPYEVVADLTVQSAVTLTIEAGVEINFPVYSSDIIVEGTLIALGTSLDSIILNGPGGIDLSENSVGSQVQFVKYNGVGATSTGSTDNTFGSGISIGGAVSTFTNNAFENCMVALTVYNGASPTIHQNTFDGSTLAAFTLIEGNPVITDNTFLNHALYGAELRLGSPTLQTNTFQDNNTALYLNGVLTNPVIENNSFTGSNIDVITHPELLDDELYDGNGFTTVFVNARNISNSTTWHKVQDPEVWQFQSLGLITTSAGLTLTIEPGFEIDLTNYTHDIDVEGTLIANGTASDSIKINGPGGIDISENSANSEVSYLRFQGVGATSSGSADRTLGAGLSVGGSNATISHSSFSNTMHGLVVYGTADPSISDCAFEVSHLAAAQSRDGNPSFTNNTFDNVSLYGLEVRAGAVTIQNNSFSNAGTALFLDGVLSSLVIENNTFTTNTRDIITHPELLDDAFYDGNGFTTIYVNARTVSNSTTWHKVESPESWAFVGLGRIPTLAGITLTMEPGFEMTLTNYSHDIEVEGTLIANGTATDSIKINGPGGLDISENSTNSEVSYFWFEGIGATSGGSTDRTFGGGLSIGGSNATVSNSRFTNSAIGVAIYNGASPTLSSCEFATAAFQGFRVVTGASSPTIENSCFSDISFDAVQNLGTGTVNALNNWWGDPTGPFNATSNAAGLGDPVSDGVTFDPWLTSDPCLPPEISIDTQPVSIDGCEGANVSLVVAASGADNLQYQWQENQGSGFNDLTDGGAISGATSATLSISAIQSAMDGFLYQCVISGDNASDVTTNSVLLDLIAPVSIDAQPSDLMVTTGDLASFQIVASGDNLSYQWQKDNVDIPGATSATYSIASSALSDAGTFHCVVSNACGNLPSENATLTVNNPVISITLQPEDTSACTGSQVSFAIAASGTTNLAYQWQEDQGGGFSNLIDGPVISGALSPTVVIDNVQGLMNGFVYRCVVTGDNAADLPSDTVTLVVIDTVEVTQQPINLEVTEGETASFSVTATGENLNFQWRWDGQNLSGETAATLSITDVTISNEGAYTCLISNDCNSVETSAAMLTVNAVQVGIREQDSLALVDLYNSTGGSQWINQENWLAANQKVEDWFGIELNALGTHVSAIALATNGLTATLPSSLDNLDSLRQLDVSNNDLDSLATNFSALTVATTLDLRGNRLDFRDLEPVASLPSVNYANQQPVTVLEQTGPLQARAGTNVTLSTSVAGTANQYVWRFNGQEIAGATSSTYVIEALSRATEGTYEVLAQNTLVPSLTFSSQPIEIEAKAVISVDVLDDTFNPLNEQVNAYLFPLNQDPLDTLEFAGIPGLLDTPSSFDFPEVDLEDYLLVVESVVHLSDGNGNANPDANFVPTFYGDVVQSVEADTLFLQGDTTLQITMIPVPEVPSGSGSVTGTIEEDFANETERITARRRAKNRKCGLRRRRTGGRTHQETELYDLIAYGETNDQGEFEFGFLPAGTYRFFVEYPGIPIDGSAFIQFDIGEAGASDNTLVLAVFVSPDGIEIALVLGWDDAFVQQLQLYPNPTPDWVTITFPADNQRALVTEVLTQEGKVLERQTTDPSRTEHRLDLRDLPSGPYLIRIADLHDGSQAIYRVIKK